MTIQKSLFATALCFLAAATATAQTSATAPNDANPVEAQSPPAANHLYLDKTMRTFNDNYRLGPGDEISVRVKGQPTYSVEKMKVSPTGTIYHELVGEISVVGMSTNQVTEILTTDLSEYLRNPQVSVQLVEAASAKISVFGEVPNPGVVVMSRPMRLLDAISEAGGFSDTGNKSAVEVIRQHPNGNRIPMRFDVKKYLEGRGSPESNIMLQAGDLVVVHGNARKTLATIGSIAGLGSFVNIIGRGW
ncbi:MAG: polysaccharide biosynthesis/export family protein [Blastocatellia bacterium]